jgi:hypothetical protein
MEDKKFYRYDKMTTAGFLDSDYPVKVISSYTRLVCHEYNLFKETPKGYWIGYGSLGGLHGKQRWVSKTSKKRYAYPTKEEALNNFIKRTERRIEYLETDIYDCKTMLSDAKKLLGSESIK